MKTTNLLAIGIFIIARVESLRFRFVYLIFVGGTACRSFTHKTAFDAWKDNQSPVLASKFKSISAHET